MTVRASITSTWTSPRRAASAGLPRRASVGNPPAAAIPSPSTTQTSPALNGAEPPKATRLRSCSAPAPPLSKSTAFSTKTTTVSQRSSRTGTAPRSKIRSTLCEDGTGARPSSQSRSSHFPSRTDRPLSWPTRKSETPTSLVEMKSPSRWPFPKPPRRILAPTLS